MRDKQTSLHVILGKQVTQGGGMLTAWPPVALVVCLCFWVGAARGQEPAIQSGCEDDYAPFSFVNEAGEADGFSVELMAAAAEAVGRKVTFRTGPWAQLKEALAQGRLEALPLVGRTQERETIFDFTFPYLTLHGTIVVRQDNADIVGPEDLAGKRVAVLREDNAHEYLRRANLGAEIVALPSFIEALTGLSEGRYDAVVMQKLLAYHLMREHELGNLRTVGGMLEGFTQSFCFAVREGDAEMLSLLNEGLSIVMADGTFRQLYTKWFARLEAMERTRSRIVVGGETHYPPYEFLDENGQPTGYTVDLTRAIAAQMGLDVDVRLDTWNEVREGLQRGEIDALQGMFYSAERDEQLSFSPPHSIVQHVIVIRKGTEPLLNLSDLAGKTILVMQGDIMHDLAVERGYGDQVIAVDTQEEALRRLAAGEGDCALAAELPALYWFRENGWDNLQIAGPPVLSAEYCFAVRHGDEYLLSVFTEGLAAVKQTGEYRAIRAQWLAPLEEPGITPGDIIRYLLLVTVPLIVVLAAAFLWLYALRSQVRQRTADLREANLALQKSEEQFRTLADNMSQLAWMADDTGWIFWYNQRWYDYTGTTPEEMQGWGWRQVHHPDHVNRVVEKISRCFATGAFWEDLFPLRGRDGQYRWFLSRAVPIRDEAGKVVRWFGTSTDVTEQRETAEALRRSEDFAHSILASSVAGLYIYDLSLLTMTYVSPRYTALTGYTLESLQALPGRAFLELIHPDDREQMVSHVKGAGEMADGQVREMEYRFRTAGGRWMWCLSRETVFARNEDGSVRQYLGTFLDITDRRRAEEALRELNETLEERVEERTEQLRGLTLQLTRVEQQERKRLARVLHDHIQQLIVAARMQLGWMGRLRDPEEVKESAREMDAILQEALDASRSLTVDLSPPVLHEAGLVGGLNWLASDMKKKHQFVVDVQAEKKAEPASEEMRILLFESAREMLLNAVKHSGVSRAMVSLMRTDQGHIRLMVADEGRGFDPTMLRNRRPDEVSYGLFSIQERMAPLGGRTEIESAPGKGTRITLTVPAVEARDRHKAAGAEAGREEAVALRHKEALCSVLIVDDHKIMREGLAKLFRLQSDIEVVGEAADGPEAIELTDELRPDVVIMDVNLGAMSGVEATERILERHPQIKVIGLSMHADPSVADSMLRAGARAYLTKSGPSEELISAVRRQAITA